MVRAGLQNVQIEDGLRTGKVFADIAFYGRFLLRFRDHECHGIYVEVIADEQGPVRMERLCDDGNMILAKNLFAPDD